MSLYDRDYAKSQSESRYGTSALSTFIKQTYQLFAASLLAGSAGAYIGIAALAPYIRGIVPVLILFGIELILLFALLAKKKESPLNLILLFAFTFCTGLALTPLLYSVLALPAGASIVAQAFALTAVAFGALSIFAMNTKRDFTTMGKMLFIALIVLICASLFNLFFNSPVLQLAIASIGAILFSFYILYKLGL